MKNMPKKVRKGSTLAEICVVLAVVSIVSTVVLSFCMMANRRAVASANRLRIMEERKMIETIVETWCENMVAAGKDISIGGENDISVAFSLNNDGMLTAKMLDGSDIQFKFDVAKSLTFNVISHDLSGFEGLGDAEKKDLLNDVLIVCTVEFDAIGVDSAYTPKYIFTVNSRSGESMFVESEQTAQPDDSKPTEPPVTPETPEPPVTPEEEQGEAGGAE